MYVVIFWDKKFEVKSVAAIFDYKAAATTLAKRLNNWEKNKQFIYYVKFMKVDTTHMYRLISPFIVKE